MGEPKIFVSYARCVVLSGMVLIVGWRRFNRENHSSKDGKFSYLAGSEPWWMEQKSARISPHITGKSHDNRKSSANDNTNFRTDLLTFMYNGFQKCIVILIFLESNSYEALSYQTATELIFMFFLFPPSLKILVLSGFSFFHPHLLFFQK